MSALEPIRRIVDLSWAAGVLDAAGRFVAVPRRGKSGVGLYTPRIILRGKHSREPIMVGLHDVLGGTWGRMGEHDTYEWQASGAKACLAVDEALLPYLRSKARSCQLHLELCRLIVDYQRPTFDTRTISAEERRRRQALAGQLERLSRLQSRAT